MHILLLRKTSLKLTGRGVADLAKGLALYNRIPEALLPHFPKYKDLLNDFANLRTFHEKFPYGLTFAVEEVNNAHELPVFAAESLDKLTTELLIREETFQRLGRRRTFGSFFCQSCFA